MAYRRYPESPATCHLCEEPAKYEEGSTKCTKCKARTCAPCFELQSDQMQCNICAKTFCTSCFTIHQIADCDDCDSKLCHNTYKSHPKKHIYCFKCDRYKCFKLPQPALIRHLEDNHKLKFNTSCSKCLWKHIKCYICKNLCKTCPYDCHKCHSPVCEDCKSRGRLSNETHLCQVCEFHDARNTVKFLRDNYRKARIAYLLKIGNPIIGRYTALFIHR